MLVVTASPARAVTEGYAWPPSVAQGDTVGLYVSSPFSPFSITVVRQGVSEVVYQTFSGLTGVVQAVPESSYANGCGWAPTVRFQVPNSWPSGVYLAKFNNNVGSFVGTYAIFTVRENVPGSTSPILFQNSITTWQAYNNWGGKSIYDYNSTGFQRSSRVSFQRPYTNWSGRGQFVDWELQFVQWIESAGFTVEYCTSLDTHRDPGLLTHYPLFMSVGHDEYWSKEMRDNVEARIASRKNVAIFSGNTCWWQVRFTPDMNRMICYKDWHTDPLYGVDNSRVTVNWTSWPVSNPENPVIGVSYLHGGYVNAQGWYPASQGYGDYTAYRTNHWVFDGTGLSDGQEFGYAAAIVGFETDGALFSWKNGLPIVTGVDGGPISYKILGVSPASYAFATMGIYKRGGTLFNAATTNWSHGLAGPFPDPIVQRITKNVIEALAGITAVLPANEPPVLLPPDYLISGTQTPIVVPIESMDPELGALTFSATGLPPGLVVNPTNGTITGTIPIWGARTLPYDVEFLATDGGTPAESTLASWDWTVTGTVGVSDPGGAIPRLFPAQPNPMARAGTHLRYETVVAGPVAVAVWDVQGRKVRDIERSGFVPAGIHEASWDGRDDGDRPVAPGVYLVTLRAGTLRASQKLVVLER